MENKDRIVLLAKEPGLTSFASLRNVKKAFNTQKVGHTGTLDSFACGLLVVCTGHLTKLCGQITASNKVYEAVIHFGKETDTCEYTGETVKETQLPKENDFRKAFEKWRGELEQTPPVFSAIHVDGKRASDLVRQGKNIELPSRKITIFSSKIIELSLNDKGLVEYAHVEFHVSKGTYIRSLARDIGTDAGSSAHLTGLCRTKVGNFELKDSCGFSTISDFGIQSACLEEKKYFENLNKEKIPFDLEKEKIIQTEIVSKSFGLDKKFSEFLGYSIMDLKDEQSYESFINGRPLKSSMFEKSLWAVPVCSQIAVYFKNVYTGMLSKNSEGRVKYDFVIHT